ncbi:sulfur carrier protein ThiS [Thermoanaerobacterium sp. CMT5567-10]|uniref:sulfur carrier protein ThiS n=1 Tax=Thermoanaerobacterium sp. CMT5567-10 TaxID=3061989 RepID=UPI0026DF6E35|nr:sulfur carrier protein ThiS [Thermoanaerobacterium sp. CMT5567-10]WKV09266.1 sulfur carrier protein ThiS [Thermoanaerobacterium sp. CMT5567-10]
MNIKVNGNDQKIDREYTVKELLDVLNVKMKEYVTVQLNDEILSRDDFDKITVKDGDIVEFLYYMGGGGR